ncbi:MAG: hypothetical protein QM775_16220 [Pirellulales bacterium]
MFAVPRIEELDAYTKSENWGYRPGEQPAAEPLALAALAFVGRERSADALPLLDKLCELQSPDGALGIYQGQAAPHWGTSLAILAWSAALKSAKPPSEDNVRRYRAAVVRGCEFLLKVEGKTIPPGSEVSHNTLLIGWPWIESTHSWLEPTALCLMALKAAGMRAYPRCREALDLLLDRILPGGGCNYGNTIVLGQVLRPHVQPTGIMLLAVAGDADNHERVVKSIAWLQQSLDEQTTSASLAYALLGLAVQGKSPADADDRIRRALTLPTAGVGASLPRLPLLALASLGDKCPLVTLSREGAAR